MLESLKFFWSKSIHTDRSSCLFSIGGNFLGFATTLLPPLTFELTFFVILTSCHLVDKESIRFWANLIQTLSHLRHQHLGQVSRADKLALKAQFRTLHRAQPFASFHVKAGRDGSWFFAFAYLVSFAGLYPDHSTGLACLDVECGSLGMCWVLRQEWNTGILSKSEAHFGNFSNIFWQQKAQQIIDVIWLRSCAPLSSTSLWRWTTMNGSLTNIPLNSSWTCCGEILSVLTLIVMFVIC